MTKAMNGAIVPSFAKNGHEALKHVQNSLNEITLKNRTKIRKQINN